MLKRTLVTATLALLLVPAAAGARAKPVAYKGKTHEGTKISFVIDRGWVDRLYTLLPTTCISAQGGTPQVSFTIWDPPYKFKLGSTQKLEYGDPTKHYTITTHRHGRHVRGKLSMNYSMLGSDNFGGYKIWHCLATGGFDLRPR
jgi:hypothetical protein